jgi:hypothetical protein
MKVEQAPKHFAPVTITLENWLELTAMIDSLRGQYLPPELQMLLKQLERINEAR